MTKRSHPSAQSSIVEESLPTHVKHFQHSALFAGLSDAIEELISERVLLHEHASALVEMAAVAFEEEFEKPPVSLTALNLGTGTGITNYRHDSGYWELVIRGPVEVQLDNMKNTVGLLGIEGSGGSLSKGKTTAQGLRAAHTRQQALDGKAAAKAAADLAEEEDSEWSEDE